MEVILYAVIAALWTLLNVVGGYMIKSALQKIGILETKIADCVTQDKCDKLQVANNVEFKAIYKHSDDKFNQVMTVIKDSNDRLEKKFDKMSDKLNEHLIESHG